MTKDKVILGIDPGTVVMGYGVLQVKNNVLSVVTLGVLKLDRYKDQADRLKVIFDRLYCICSRSQYSYL